MELGFVQLREKATIIDWLIALLGTEKLAVITVMGLQLEHEGAQGV